MGTIALRKNNLKQALNYYEQIPNTYNSLNYHGWYLERNPYNFYNYSKKKYKKEPKYANKAYFVKTLIEKKEQYKKATGDKKADIAIELGNAYFNMSYFGKHWHYVAYGKSVYGGSVLWTMHNTYINKNYKQCNIALDYYQKAISLYTDKTKKAKAIFFAASIKNDSQYFIIKAEYNILSENNEIRYNSFDKIYKDKDDYQENIFIKQLKQNFPNKYDYYLKECPGIKYF